MISTTMKSSMPPQMTGLISSSNRTRRYLCWTSHSVVFISYSLTLCWGESGSALIRARRRKWGGPAGHHWLCQLVLPPPSQSCYPPFLHWKIKDISYLIFLCVDQANLRLCLLSLSPKVILVVWNIYWKYLSKRSFL